MVWERMDGIRLARDRDHRQVVVNTVMNLRVNEILDIFLQL
jgi:hypothetical protein